MCEYKEKIMSCSGCGNTINPLSHKLFHETGLASGIIEELGLTTTEQIKVAFRNSTQISKCFILLNGRKTKIREENKYLLPRDIIELIPNLTIV